MLQIIQNGTVLKNDNVEIVVDRVFVELDGGRITTMLDVTNKIHGDGVISESEDTVPMYEIAEQSKDISFEGMSVKRIPKCNCGKRIVYFLDKPSIFVCDECQITLDSSYEVCPICKGKITIYERKVK